VRIKGFFVREANPAYVIHGKKVRFKASWRCSGGRIKIKKPNLDTWEPNPLPNKDYTQK
jgi:hypothetical protein